MKKNKITINPLQPDSIENAIKVLENLTSQEKLNEFSKRLAERGVEIAKARLVTLGATFTNELLNSVHVEDKGDGVFVIKTDSDHAAFVEFGTGQLGQEGSYPYPFPEGANWAYNVGSTIFEIEDGQYGWFYPADDGTWKFTQGMPSRPFMYETALQLREEISKVAKEVFSKK